MNVVVRENKFLELLKLPQFAQIGMRHDVIKPDVLKRDFIDCLLKFHVGQDFKRVAINEKHGISLNLSMATLHKTLVSLLFTPLVAI